MSRAVLDMRIACKYGSSMGKFVTIRKVPDQVHRVLKTRAAAMGVSLSDYVLTLMRQMAERPTVEEMRGRLAALPPVRVKTVPADLIRQERDRR